jgi:hypothetical protein
MVRIGRYVLGSVFVGYGTLHILGRQAGSTAQERRRRMPGDELVARPQILTNHAITVEARPADVWPWLTQMGWHLGGYYTPEWVDRLLFPQNWPSLDRLDPVLQRDLKVGDTIPDGPPGTAKFVVAEVDAPHTLVLHSTTHLPPHWRERFGADLDWTWSSGSPSCPAAVLGCSCESEAEWRRGGWSRPTSPRSSQPTSSWLAGCCAGSSNAPNPVLRRSCPAGHHWPGKHRPNES